MSTDTSHDSGYKQLFSHPDMVRDLLTGFVPGPWLQSARFDTLERVNASYVSESDRQRHDDMVWRLQVGPRWVWIYLLLEFQSRDDPWMAVHIRNMVEALFKLERSTGSDEIIQLILAAGKALQAPEQKALQRTLDLWFRRLIRRKMPQTAEPDLAAIPNLFEGAPMLENTLERIFKQAHKDGLKAGRQAGFHEGREEGREEGRDEGISLMLRRVLEQRFDHLPPWAVQRLNEATRQQLDQWSQHMLSAPNLEALLNRTEG